MFVPPKQPRLVAQHEKARQLRYLGMPIKQIAGAVGVSPASVSVWVRDIELLPRHREAIIRRNRDARLPGGRNDVWREICRSRRRGYQEAGRERARRGDVLHASGCMLYWAEGSKSRNTAHLSNSDSAMLAFFARFLRECFGIASDDMTFSLNVYTNNGLTIEEIESYWMDLLRLPQESARKHILNHMPTSSSGSKQNKLPYGVCTLRVKRSTWLVQHIYGAIQEYSGSIRRPGWMASTESSALSPNPPPSPSRLFGRAGGSRPDRRRPSTRRRGRPR